MYRTYMRSNMAFERDAPKAARPSTLRYTQTQLPTLYQGDDQ